MKKRELKKKKDRYISEIAGDAFFFSLLKKKSLWSTITHLIQEGYTPPILMDPINVLRLELSKNKISGI